MSAEITVWEDPDGAVTTLDVDWDADGRYMPEVYFEEDETPGQDGSRNRSTRFKPHEFTLLLTVVGTDEPTLRTAVRNLVSAMNPKRGMGKIRVTSPLGDVREINCKAASGLGVTEKAGVSGPTMQQIPVTFRAFDPLWRDASDTTDAFVINDPVSFFPFFPLRLTNSQIAVDDTVNNTGDDDAWPVWTIVGPGSVIKLSNLTTGEVISLPTTTLGVGESIVIDSGAKTATRQDGSNAFPALDIFVSTMWALQVGVNLIRLEMSAAVVGVSSLQVSYRKRYLSP